MQYPILIVGAGASGIGMGVLLKRLGLPFVIVDQQAIGASFCNWCKQTQFISPSFAGNAFGAVDLNAVTPDTSPAFTLRCEHPTGKAYAQYLLSLAKFFELPVKTHVRVNGITHQATGEFKYLVDITKNYQQPNESNSEIKANHIIWAAGEFCYPKKDGFSGAEHCMHYAEVESWADILAEEFYLIGGYESGIDSAYQITKLEQNLGKKVTLFDGNNRINMYSSDSSHTLSPFSRDRFATVKDKVKVISTRVTAVRKTLDTENNQPIYEITTSDKTIHKSSAPPINCTGFLGSVSLIKDLFEFEQGRIKLNQYDESTICPNVFLVGPQVRHGEAIFCFIYKYRQRFGIVGEELSKRLFGNQQLREEIIGHYKKQQFYLDDLSCCEDECMC